jgi:short-subunit dehydrogenase
MLEVNVLGATATLTAVLPAMIERRRGHVVGVSSLSAFVTWPKMTTYSASKAYLTHFLAGLTLELKGKGVKVTTVHPGFVKSEMTAHNRFKMPFLLETDDAATRIAEGIVRGEEVVSFPWQMAVASRALQWVPTSALGLLVGKRK